MGIAAININEMTIATVMTVGARLQCPTTQEHHRGGGNWLTMRNVSVGSGHGPSPISILFGVSRAGGGGHLRQPRELIFPT
jgi:hypothetical protein